MNHDDDANSPRGHETEAATSAAESLARRLDQPMGVLGLVFLLVVLGQLTATDPGLQLGLSIAGWVFWAVFLAEFILRAYIAGNSRTFWRTNWWQVIFLLVPFLRFFRALQAIRLLRIGRVVRVGGILSAGIRGSRSAGRLLSSRIAWLAAVTAVVILAVSQLLYATGTHSDYSDALRNGNGHYHRNRHHSPVRFCPRHPGSARGLLRCGLRQPRRLPGRILPPRRRLAPRDARRQGPMRLLTLS